MREKINGTTIVIWSAAVNILLGLILLIFEQIELEQIVYVFSAFFVVMGIFYIVKYFIKESYKELNCYNFSAGVLLVVLGICAMVRAEKVSEYLAFCLAIILLIGAVIKLQNALDLKAIEDKYWAVFLAVAVFLIVCAVLVVLNPFEVKNNTQVFTYAMLVVDGILSLIEIFYLSARLKKRVKNELRMDGVYDSAADKIDEMEEAGSNEGE